MSGVGAEEEGRDGGVEVVAVCYKAEVGRAKGGGVGVWGIWGGG